MFKKIMTLSIIGLLCGAGGSFAQFKMGNTQGLLNSASSTYTGQGVSISDLAASTAQAITAYFDSLQELDLGLQNAAEAFGVKNEVMGKLGLLDLLAKDSVNSNDLDKVRQSFQEAQGIITQKIQGGSVPSLDGKALLTESMIHIAASIEKNTALSETLIKLSSQLQDVQATAMSDVMAAQKIEDASISALILNTALPQDIKLEKKMLNDDVAYANANGISVPDNVPDLLKEAS